MRLQSFLKSITIFAVTVALTLCLSACHRQQADAFDSNGNPIVLKNYLGKWVIINYWATWCKPCIAEMSTLNSLYKSFKNKIIVLGVNYDQLAPTAINAIAKQYRFQYPLLASFPIQRFYRENITILPITFILNPKGHLVKILKGPRTMLQFKQALGL